jgi:hypothetical protein
MRRRPGAWFSACIDVDDLGSGQMLPSWKATATIVRVRIISRPTEASVDGVGLSDFRAGCVYALPTELATLMIVEGWAEPIDGDADPVLPEFHFNIVRPAPRILRPQPRILGTEPRRLRRRHFSDSSMTPHLGLAADRKPKRPRRR